METVKRVGPHTFRNGAVLCGRCGATLSGATLDAEGVPTVEGLPYCRYPACRVAPAKSGLIRRMPGLALRAVRAAL